MDEQPAPREARQGSVPEGENIAENADHVFDGDDTNLRPAPVSRNGDAPDDDEG